MKRFPVIGIILLIPAFLVLGMVGCQPPKDNKGADGAKSDGSKKGSGGKKSPAKEIAGAPEGIFKGAVKYKGTPPDEKKIAAISEHKDKAICLKGGGDNIVDQTWLIHNDMVENVVISLEPAEGWKFKDDEALKKKFEKKKQMIDQPFCAFVPHVVAVYADVEPLYIKNSASIPHNSKIIGGTLNGNKNENLPPGEQAGPFKFSYDRNPIPVACDAHTWMTARILTFEHPYFAVTNKKGEFEIKNVPEGAELTVYMWHESMDAKKSMGTITCKDKTPVTKDLEISK